MIQYPCRDLDDLPPCTPGAERMTYWQLIALHQHGYRGRMPKTYAAAAQSLAQLAPPLPPLEDTPC